MKYSRTVMVKNLRLKLKKFGGAGKSLSRQPAERRETVVKSEPVVETKVAAAPVEAAPAATSTTGGTTITSPMPGSILDVKVNVGDKVKFGPNSCNIRSNENGKRYPSNSWWWSCRNKS